MQTAQCVLTIALCLTRKVYADLKIGVLTMGKQHLSRDDRLIMKGKLQGDFCSYGERKDDADG